MKGSARISPPSRQVNCETDAPSHQSVGDGGSDNCSVWFSAPHQVQGRVPDVGQCHDCCVHQEETQDQIIQVDMPDDLAPTSLRLEGVKLVSVHVPGFQNILTETLLHVGQTIPSGRAISEQLKFPSQCSPHGEHWQSICSQLLPTRIYPSLHHHCLIRGSCMSMQCWSSGSVWELCMPSHHAWCHQLYLIRSDLDARSNIAVSIHSHSVWARRITTCHSKSASTGKQGRDQPLLNLKSTHLEILSVSFFKKGHSQHAADLMTGSLRSSSQQIYQIQLFLLLGVCDVSRILAVVWFFFCFFFNSPFSVTCL